MAAPVIGVQNRRAPSRGASVDRSHPLSQGLEFCFVPAADANRDIARGFVASAAGSAVTMAGSTFGPAMLFAGDARLQFSGLPDARVTGLLTVMFVGQLIKLGSGVKTSFAFKSNADANSFNNPFGLYANTSGEVIGYRSKSSGIWSFLSFTLTNQRAVMIALYPPTLDLSAPHYFNDEYYSAPPDVASTGTATGSSAAITIGSISTSAGSFLLNALAIWSRQLNAGEARALYADPFCYLKV